MIAATFGKFYVQAGGGTFAAGYDAGESMRIRRDLQWGRAIERDEDNMVGKDRTRELARLKCADLRRNMPIVAGICDRLAMFAAPLLPQVRTSDEAWNEAAESWWTEVYVPGADNRGRLSLDEIQRTAVSMRPTHGGLYIELMQDGTVRPVECERIRQPTNPIAAKGFCDGVQVDPATGRVLAYCIHGRDSNGSFSGPHQERIVPAESVQAVIRQPHRIDQVREIGDFFPAVPALQDLHEANKYTLGTLKNQSQYIGMLNRAGGMSMNSGPRGSTPTVGKTQTEETEWGMLLKGQPGDALTMASSPTPSGSHVAYMKYCWAIAAPVLSLPYEFFTLDLSTLDYSRQKGLFVLVNNTMEADWHPWLARRMMQPLWNWRIAMETAPGGALYPAPVGKGGVSEWAKVEWFAPPQLSIDRQEANQADIIEMQVGSMTLGQKLRRKGKDVEKQMRARAREIKLIERVAGEEGVDASRLHMLQIPGQTGAVEGTEADRVQPMQPARKGGDDE